MPLWSFLPIELDINVDVLDVIQIFGRHLITLFFRWRYFYFSTFIVVLFIDSTLFFHSSRRIVFHCIITKYFVEPGRSLENPDFNFCFICLGFSFTFALYSDANRFYAIQNWQDNRWGLFYKSFFLLCRCLCLGRWDQSYQDFWLSFCFVLFWVLHIFDFFILTYLVLEKLSC